ncbi:MAG: pre-peptidase C-terminal domain-containing protein, partial [Chloroflexota bacterium]
GTYTLGVSAEQALTLSGEGVTQVSGRLQDVFPVERWAFAGQAGDVLTFTMTADAGTLDPALTLYKPDGDLLAFNDDASDPLLEINAQLTQVRLPDDGTYRVEAGRYVGAGEYRLVIVSTAQNS